MLNALIDGSLHWQRLQMVESLVNKAIPPIMRPNWRHVEKLFEREEEKLRSSNEALLQKERKKGIHIESDLGTTFFNNQRFMFNKRSLFEGVLVEEDEEEARRKRLNQTGKGLSMSIDDYETSLTLEEKLSFEAADTIKDEWNAKAIQERRERYREKNQAKRKRRHSLENGGYSSSSTTASSSVGSNSHNRRHSHQQSTSHLLYQSRLPSVHSPFLFLGERSRNFRHLDEVLRDSLGFSFFRKFCREHYQEENLIFWLEVERLKGNLGPSPELMSLLALAKAMMNNTTFVFKTASLGERPGLHNEINTIKEEEEEEEEKEKDGNGRVLRKKKKRTKDSLFPWDGSPLSHAHIISSLFIDSGSEFELNISGELREQILMSLPSFIPLEERFHRGNYFQKESSYKKRWETNFSGTRRRNNKHQGFHETLKLQPDENELHDINNEKDKKKKKQQQQQQRKRKEKEKEGDQLSDVSTTEVSEFDHLPASERRRRRRRERKRRNDSKEHEKIDETDDIYTSPSLSLSSSLKQQKAQSNKEEKKKKKNGNDTSSTDGRNDDDSDDDSDPETPVKINTTPFAFRGEQKGSSFSYRKNQHSNHSSDSEDHTDNNDVKYYSFFREVQSISTIFEPAQKQVQILMEGNLWLKFKKTERYGALIQRRGTRIHQILGKVG